MKVARSHTFSFQRIIYVPFACWIDCWTEDGQWNKCAPLLDMVFSFLSSALVKRISLGTMRFYFWEMLKSNLNSPKHFFFSLFFMNFQSPLFLWKCSNVLYIEIPSHESCQVRFTVHFCIRWLPGTFCIYVSLSPCVLPSLSRSLAFSFYIFVLCGRK